MSAGAVASTERSRAGRALLALMGHRSGAVQVLSPQAWDDLDTIAAEHRVQPHLHGRFARGEIALEVPLEIAARWQTAHRANAIAMLVQRSALISAARALAEQGIASVALKGSALAWSVWPSPAERVMRDIDLLLPAERAAEGWELLGAKGWVGPDRSPQELAEAVRDDLHLPPLTSPEGVACEIHARPWLPLCALGEDTGAAMLARALPFAESACHRPSAADMLAHLVIHAAYAHRFNSGPGVLADVDYCLIGETIDWPKFWARAEREGWLRGAACTLALVDRWRRPGVLVESRCPVLAQPDVIEIASDLLVQPEDARKDIGALAAMQGGTRYRQPGWTDKDERTVGQRVVDLADRAKSLAGSLLDPEVRHAASQTAAIDAFLSEG